MIDVSIVIPTWNRYDLLSKIISICLENKNLFNNLEILVCDSNSFDETKNLKKNFKNPEVVHVHAKSNSISAKRNLGIKTCKFQNIIFFDDDCIPNTKLLLEYSEKFKFNSLGKIIFFGKYLTPLENIKNSNYHAFRDYQNKKIYNNYAKTKKLNFTNIITGNMGFSKKIILENKIFFNENLIGYGCEDVEWAFELTKNKITFELLENGCLHLETSKNVDNYLLKWKNMIIFTIPYLKKYNLNCYKQTSFYYYEKFLLLKKVFGFFFKIFYQVIVYLLLKFDNVKFFRIYLMYRFLIFSIFFVHFNEERDEDDLNNWMKKGYK